MRVEQKRIGRSQGRIKGFYWVVVLAMAILTARVYQIQIIDGPSYAAMAASQQRIAILRTNSDWSETTQDEITGSYVFILRRDCVEEETQALLKRIGAEERKTSNDKYRIFASDHFDKVLGERLHWEYGAYIIRLSEDGHRESDTEKMDVLYSVADGANRILTGYGINVLP